MTLTITGPDYIYFIKPIGMDGPIKIGCSSHPLRRLEELSAWSPFPLEIIITVPGEMSVETALHRCLAKSHSHREWFHPTSEVVGLVEKLKSGATLHDAIDLTNPVGSIRKKCGGGSWSELTRKKMSYDTRVRHACNRAAKHFGERVHAPAAVNKAIDAMTAYRWRDARWLTDAEVAAIEAFILDPITHGVRHSDWLASLRKPLSVVGDDRDQESAA